MRVIRLVVHATSRQPVLVLGEADGDRCLPVFLRGPQADVISVGPRGPEDPLLPQDVLVPVLRGLGHRLDDEELTDLTDGVFSAVLVLDGGTPVPVLPSAARAVAGRALPQLPRRCHPRRLRRPGALMPAQRTDLIRWTSAAPASPMTPATP